MIFRDNNREVVLASVFQTYDFYKDKEWKGLDPELKVEVHRAKLGKVGIAAGYKRIQEDEAAPENEPAKE